MTTNPLLTLGGTSTVRARKSISVTNEVRVELYHQAQYNQCVTVIDLRALSMTDHLDFGGDRREVSELLQRSLAELASDAPIGCHPETPTGRSA